MPNTPRPFPLTQQWEEADQLIAQGNRAEDLGQFEAALSSYYNALARAPTYPRAHLNVGNALRRMGCFDEAADAFREALRRAPEYAPAHFNLAALLASRGEYAGSEIELRKALRLTPTMVEAIVVLADVLESSGRLQEAETELRRALTINPAMAGAALNLGQLLLKRNRFEEAEKWFLQAKMSDPVLAKDALSASCFAMNYRGDLDPRIVFAAHLRAGRTITNLAGKPYTNHPNVPNAERRIKLGYVSGDFHQHPIGLFMRSILELHDRRNFEIFCYANNSKTDHATLVLEQLVENWRMVTSLDDHHVAEQIRADQVDILVDLSGHTDDNRLAVFARRVAPVQATWLGYLNTTGLASMDYRICDRYTDPPGLTEDLHSERLFRLPNSQWCYTPWYDINAARQPHADRPGATVLGSFNQYGKISDACLDLWCRILVAVPDSELVILDVSEDRARKTLRDRIASRGVDTSRLTIRGREGILEYFAAIGNVDIALDTFPYNGATTTLDTLWMGTPLVALRGDRGIARGSYSILQSARMPELIATTPEEYVDTNVRLARDAAWRSSLRGSLRERLSASPPMDAKQFVGDLETGYRQMWREWCTERLRGSA